MGRTWLGCRCDECDHVLMHTTRVCKTNTSWVVNGRRSLSAAKGTHELYNLVLRSSACPAKLKRDKMRSHKSPVSMS